MKQRSPRRLPGAPSGENTETTVGLVLYYKNITRRERRMSRSEGLEASREGRLPYADDGSGGSDNSDIATPLFISASNDFENKD